MGSDIHEEGMEGVDLRGRGREGCVFCKGTGKNKVFNQTAILLDFLYV